MDGAKEKLARVWEQMVMGAGGVSLAPIFFRRPPR